MLKQILITCCALCSLIAQTHPSYHSYNELTDKLNELSRRSSIVTLSSIGTTLQGRKLWALTIGKSPENKALLVVGGVQAEQVSGSEHALRFAEFLVSSYGSVDSITTVLNTTTVYIIPRINPDASEAYFHRPLVERTANDTPDDDDHDGAADEDDVEDLNKDGIISWMRVRDPEGEWIANPDDTRLMRKAEASKGERGVYKLYSEGIDNDKDEQWNEDGIGGTDINHNFAYQYKYFSPHSGRHQMSEVETRALGDFLFDHQNIAVVFTFSDNDNLTASWKHVEPKSGTRFVSSVEKADEGYFECIAKKFQEITHYAPAPPSVKGTGSFSETAYYHAGRWSFAVRPWWPGPLPKHSDTTASRDSAMHQRDGGTKSKSGEDDWDLKTLRWYDAVGVKDIAVEWKSFRHPDFPGKEVEIGGVKPFIHSDPPPDSLAAFGSGMVKFMTFLAGQLPSIALTGEKVEKIGDDVFRVSVDVVNNGYLPTNSDMGVKTRWVRNVRVVCNTGNARIASGKEKQLLTPIAGSGGFSPLSWVIVGTGTVTITAGSPVCGTASIKLPLR